MSRFELTQIQAQAILDMQLRRLASLERQKILDEYEQLLKTINYLEELLANPKRIYVLIAEDVKDLREKYGDSRRTQIAAEEFTEFRKKTPFRTEGYRQSQRSWLCQECAGAPLPPARGGRALSGW